MSAVPAAVESLAVEAEGQGLQLQKLSERHKTAAALLAQGVARQTVAQAVQYTPEYVTWLQRQPLFIQYVKEMNQAAAVQLEAMFARSVEVISEGMNSGGEVGLKAARMQLEATGRIGRERSVREGGDPSADRLSVLAERLIGLLDKQRGRTFEHGQVSESSD